MPRKNPKRSRSQSKASAVARSSRAAKNNPAKKTVADISQRVTPIVDLGKLWQDIGTRHPTEFRVSFVRPEDLLVCDFIFHNLVLPSDGSNQLVRRNPQRFATLIVELPPQSFGERAFLDATEPEVPKPISEKEKKFEESGSKLSVKPPSKNVATPNAESLGALPFAMIRMAGKSRIAFTMPASETGLAFTLDAILDACRRWPMQLDVNAVPDPNPLVKSRRGAVVSKASSVTSAASSPAATLAEQLIDALGSGKMLRPPLADSARRIAKLATEALNSGASAESDASIQRLMTEELDVLAARFEQVSDASGREVVAAVLSLMSADAYLTMRGIDSAVGLLDRLPFLPLVFGPHEPSPITTALELPYRVILSPVPQSNWWHETKPVVRNGRTELWHTRLTKTSDGVGVDPPTRVRALWSPDYPMTSAQILKAVNNVQPFRMSLDALDRQMLVRLMAGFDEATRGFTPLSARSQRLALSSLGALLDVEGSWQHLPPGVGLEQWRHRATLGRDHYVRVVYRGFLMGLGHAASLIKVTERKFESLPGAGGRVAVLRQRFYIAVRQPVKHYSGAGHASAGRNFPYTSVEILTSVTPSLRAPDLSMLQDPSGTIYGAVPHRACFWPMIDASTNFKFQVAATDLAGHRVTFPMPLLFVGKEANESPATIAEIIKQYNLEPEGLRRAANLGGASVCYAPIKPGAEGDPRLPTAEMVFKTAPAAVPIDQPRFYPEVERAEVGIAAIQRLLQNPDAVVAVAYPEVYKAGGFGGGNPGEVFLKTLQPFGLEFGDKVKSDALGGLATPSMAIQGLSRIMGPVSAQPPLSPTPANIEAALGEVINNKFNPADFFKGAKILGGVDLSTILEIAHTLAGVDVPKLLSRQLPDKIEARFDWNTKINKSDPLGLFVPNSGGTTVLEMHGVVSSPIASPAATTFTATASVVNFKVNLFGFVTVWFDRLQFASKSGSKPDVAVDLHPGDDAIAFGGPLEFVNELRSIIPSNGFSDPPSLSVTPSGVSASFSISIPSVAVGIFALEHVSLGAGFVLPFDAKPAEVRFNFAERQRPFSLTVSLLGGGGFFAIGVGTEGVREIEAALEFGAALSINLGVASGSVEVKAGIYFHWMTKSVELAGYVRLHGELSVLGLISASLTFNLQIAYLKEDGHSVVWGEATLEVEIDVLFLSFSVSVKCRREFGGSDSDPKFLELIPNRPTWNSYCEAFAAEAA